MEDDLQSRVQYAAQGITPQTKPDERRRYLGSLRERVLVRMDNSETQKPELTKLFIDHIDDYTGYTILINGKITDNTFLDKVESICSQKNIAFTLINNETAKTDPEATAVLVVAKDAINRMRIEIDQVYAPEMPKTKLAQPAKKKIGFFKRLFSGDKQ